MKKSRLFYIYLLLISLFGVGALSAWLIYEAFASPINSNSSQPPFSNKIKDSESWEVRTLKLAPQNGKAAFELAKYFEKKSNFKQSELWFKQAIRLNYAEAKIALAELYFTYNKFELAKDTLDSHSLKSVDKHLILSIKIAVELGDINYIQANYHKLNQFEQGQRLYQQLKKYRIINTETKAKQLFTSTTICENSVQFIATNFKDLAKAEQHIQAFKKHVLSPYICFTPVIYQSQKKLNCRNDVNAPEQAIRCDESIWDDESTPINTRYLAIMLPKGGANVHKGILYLDSEDSFDVFVHELTHLLGFFDEYPLPQKHSACLQNQTETWAYNIAVLPKVYQGDRAKVRQDVLALIPWSDHIKPETPILMPIETTTDSLIETAIQNKDTKSWGVGTPEEFSESVGIFLSDTCNMSEFTSFKPVSYPTMLTYNEVPFPLLYLELLQNKPNAYRMPSYHLNVAQALWLKGKEQEAKMWFKRLLPK